MHSWSKTTGCVVAYNEINPCTLSDRSLSGQLLGTRFSARAEKPNLRVMAGREGTASLTERRRTPRAAVLFTASISCAGSSREIKVRNLSERGGCIEGEQLLDRMKIVIERNGQSIPGRVAWVQQHRSGVEFSTSVRLETALRQVTRPKGRPCLRSRRPALKCQPLTAAERTTMERWAVLGPQAIGD
jgi:PilZ domain